MRGAVLGLLLFAYHVLTNCLPSPYNCFTICHMPALTARCEGSRFGAAAVCIPFPYQLLTMPLQSSYYLPMPRIDSKMRGEPFWGLLLFAYHVLTNCLPCPYNFFTMCYMPRIASKMRGDPFWGCCCLHTMSRPSAYHVLTISLPFSACPELTARCEGSRFGVAA